MECDRLMSDFSGASRLAPVKPKLMSTNRWFLVALVSAVLNVFLGASMVMDNSWYLPRPDRIPRGPTDPWSRDQEWTELTEYIDPRRLNETDEKWKSLNYDRGTVALSDVEAAALDLPEAQRFPWDASKGIYFLNAFHGIHCLVRESRKVAAALDVSLTLLSQKWLHESLRRYRDGEPFRTIDWHGFHCLDSLRQDVICFADDTPRYTGLKQEEGSTGTNQTRKCRWDALEKYADDHTACWRVLSRNVTDTLDRYKFCPKGSPYQEIITRLYGTDEASRVTELYGED